MANPVYILFVFYLITLPGVLKVFHAEDKVEDERREEEEYMPDLFDFIVVGAGSAGAIVANRLSANGLNTVLLLERGGNPTNISSYPWLWLFLARIDTPGSVARYDTTPQPGFSLATNGVVHLLQGKVLGGTSTLNQMVYTRGNPHTFDEWATISGDNSWRYSSVLPYFKSFEDYHGTFIEDRENYGRSGELYIESANLVQPSVNIFFDAVRERNLPIKDVNVDNSPGFQPIDFNSKFGRRSGTYEAFIEPILERRNLYVARYATVTKIHLDDSKRATSVTYHRHGKTRIATATKEIIISAGVFETPRLLMLSGIGPAAELQALGIEPLVDLPVGKNLQDQLMVSIQTQLPNETTFVPERDYSTQTEEQYDTDGTGPMRNSFSTLGYISTAENNQDSYPDVQFFIQHQSDPGTDPEADRDIRNDTNTIAVFLVRPSSPPGEVTLQSADPNDSLRIEPNYARDPSDLRRLVEGVKFIVDLYENTNAYNAVGGAKLVEEELPAICKTFEPRSQEYWNCIVQYLGTSSHHFTGTCSMGSVVDSQLRVIGTTGLRVADASVMPSLPNCNTNAPAMMIGEKVADLILRGLRNSNSV